MLGFWVVIANFIWLSPIPYQFDQGPVVMKTLLVLADHPATPEMIQAALSPADYRTIHRTSVEDAEPMLVRGLADFCILDLNLDQVDGLWVLEQVHRRACHLYPSDAADE